MTTFWANFARATFQWFFWNLALLWKRSKFSRNPTVRWSKTVMPFSSFPTLRAIFNFNFLHDNIIIDRQEPRRGILDNFHSCAAYDSWRQWRMDVAAVHLSWISVFVQNIYFFIFLPVQPILQNWRFMAGVSDKKQTNKQTKNKNKRQTKNRHYNKVHYE